MIIENKKKYVYGLILFILIGCFMNKEPKFTISGEQEILNNLVINIKTISNDTGIEEYKVQTLLYKGNIYDLNLDDPKVIAYEIFASLNGEMVGKSIRYDNIMRFDVKDHINHIEIKINNSIEISHIMSKQDVVSDKNKRFATITFFLNKTFDAFIDSENLTKDSNEYMNYKKLFFDEYK